MSSHLRPSVRAALGALGAIAAVCIVGPWLSPYEAAAVNLASIRLPPSPAHLLGTDDLGRDLLTRLMEGGRYSLLIGLLAAVVGTGTGTLIGSVAGYAGGWMDRILMRLTDVVLAIPTLPVVIVLASFMQAGPVTIGLVIGLLSWMATARVVRGEVLRLRESDFIVAARSLGFGPVRTLFRHLLPNVAGPIAVSGTLAVGYAILLESALSFLNLGVQPPTPTWGSILMDAQASLATAPWLTVFPGTAILVTVLAVNFVGEGLRNAADPRREGA